MQDRKIRRKLFGKNNEYCMNINTESFTDCFGEEVGTGFIGQTLKEIRKIREVISFQTRILDKLTSKIEKLEKRKKN